MRRGRRSIVRILSHHVQVAREARPARRDATRRVVESVRMRHVHVWMCDHFSEYLLTGHLPCGVHLGRGCGVACLGGASGCQCVSSVMVSVASAVRSLSGRVSETAVIRTPTSVPHKDGPEPDYVGLRGSLYEYGTLPTLISNIHFSTSTRLASTDSTPWPRPCTDGRYSRTARWLMAAVPMRYCTWIWMRGMRDGISHGHAEKRMRNATDARWPWGSAVRQTQRVSEV